jgi:hypothetical protein
MTDHDRDSQADPGSNADAGQGDKSEDLAIKTGGQFGSDNNDGSDADRDRFDDQAPGRSPADENDGANDGPDRAGTLEVDNDLSVLGDERDAS